jgi:hypothetical protein
MTSWNFNEGFSVPIEWDENNIIVGGKVLPGSLLPFAKKHLTPDDEIIVCANCSGYYDEGKRYGDPDDCYPPEGGDERVISHIRFPDTILTQNGTESNQHYFNLWTDHVQSYIDKQEIDIYHYGPDYEEER